MRSFTCPGHLCDAPVCSWLRWLIPPMRLRLPCAILYRESAAFKTPEGCSPRKTSRRPYHHPPATHAPPRTHGAQGRMPYLRREAVHRIRRRRAAIFWMKPAQRPSRRAGHQLLYEPPTRVLTQYLPSIGGVVHVEVIFSFRTVRHAPGGRKVLRADHQLLDILPHPVYLLLQVLEQAGEGTHGTLCRWKSVRPGPVHALVRRAASPGYVDRDAGGRPVESYLRVIGRTDLFADYVRSTTQRAIGPGSSGIDKLFALSAGLAAVDRHHLGDGDRFLKSQRVIGTSRTLFGVL